MKSKITSPYRIGYDDQLPSPFTNWGGIFECNYCGYSTREYMRMSAHFAGSHPEVER